MSEITPKHIEKLQEREVAILQGKEEKLAKLKAQYPSEPFWLKQEIEAHEARVQLFNELDEIKKTLQKIKAENAELKARQPFPDGHYNRGNYAPKELKTPWGWKAPNERTTKNSVFPALILMLPPSAWTPERRAKTKEFAMKYGHETLAWAMDKMATINGE